MATALISALSNRPVRNNIAMTGEITLRGEVLPIGGVKEKVLAAYRAQIKKVILPIQNRKDMEDVPAETQKEMEFVFVENVQQVFREALKPMPTAPETSAPPAKAAPVKAGSPKAGSTGTRQTGQGKRRAATPPAGKKRPVKAKR